MTEEEGTSTVATAAPSAIDRKKRSRSGVIGYITRLFNKDIAKFRSEYKHEHRTNLVL